MKIKTVVIALSFLLIFTSCAPFITAEQPADNFAFVFHDTPCGPTPVNTLDSSTGTLVHTPLGTSTTITISLHLTDEELDAVYQKATNIGFFDYPTEFIIPEDQVIGAHFPASSFQLSIRNGESSNSVTWVDRALTNSSYTEADDLRELMYLIRDIIQSHPEFLELPEPKMWCV